MRAILISYMILLFMIVQAQHTEQVHAVGPLQDEIIKVLTGMNPYEGYEYLDNRSTPDGRETTSEILQKYLKDLGLEPQLHGYRAAHPMVFPDLFFAPAKGTNVYAVLEVDPVYEYVVIGAHYDAEPGSPGAGDNASGVALVMSLAKILNGYDKLQFNYIFVLFDQEEDDEIGSKAFANFLQKKEWDIHSVHVTDLAGWDKDGDGVVLIQTSDELMKATYTNASNRLEVGIHIISGGSSDNKSFQLKFPTVGVFGDVTKHLHKPTDTYETVDFEFLASITELILEVLVSLENETL